MNRNWLLLPLALACAAALADGNGTADPRINLKLTPEERVEFLAEMRQMLGSIQGVMQGIGDADRERIAAAARLSGNRMARATPDSVRARLPQSFRDLGGPTHMMFKELAVRAETDDMDSLARDAANLMNQCMACHAPSGCNDLPMLNLPDCERLKGGNASRVYPEAERM